MPYADVETVKSLVEEMETDSRDEKEIDDDPMQQGIGKRVIGEATCSKGHAAPTTSSPRYFTLQNCLVYCIVS